MASCPIYPGNPGVEMTYGQTCLCYIKEPWSLDVLGLKAAFSESGRARVELVHIICKAYSMTQDGKTDSLTF